MRHQKAFAAICAAAVLICHLPASAQDIQVLVEGTPVVFDVAPTTVNNRTFVPLRAVAEALGATVGWNEEEQKVTLTRNGIVNELVIGSLNATRTDEKGTQELTLDVAPFKVNDRTMVPLRYIAENFEMSVIWNEETQTVSISVLKPGEGTQPEAPAKKVIDFSQDKDDTRKTLHHNIRYDFEQSALVEYLLADEKATAALLETAPEQLMQGIKDVWDKTANTHLLRMLIESDEEITLGSDKELPLLLDSRRTEYALTADDVFTVSIDALTDGTPVVLLDLADIGNDSLDISCSYVALTAQKDKGLRYFTLETDPFVSSLAVCEITADTHGLHTYIENDRDLFLNAVETILAKGDSPKGNSANA